MSKVDDNPFREWIRLEQPRLGTQVVYATDDFFAPKERMIEPQEPIFIADKYDDHGKWMDGWESRRKRVPGHDFAIIRLGIPGIVRGVDIDTRHFTGNFPPAASLEACSSDAEIPGDDAAWYEIVPKTSLDGDRRHFIAVQDERPVTHCRLHIYPDGGVARLRIYGEVRPPAVRFASDERIDLLAMQNGGRALACNDEHFGSMHNLNLPGRGLNMGDGWETARRRRPGNDWVVLALGHPGAIEQIEIDTAYFKGNYPDRAEIRACLVSGLVGDSGNIVAASADWPVLLPEFKLAADTRHVIDIDADAGPVSHIRMNIFPDGGVSRLRLFGRPAKSSQ